VAVAQAEIPAEPSAVSVFEGLPTFRGLFVVGAPERAALISRLQKVLEEARAGRMPAWRTPPLDEVRYPERIALDYADAADLAKRVEKALAALERDAPDTWQALAGQGIYRGRGHPAKLPFSSQDRARSTLTCCEICTN